MEKMTKVNALSLAIALLKDNGLGEDALLEKLDAMLSTEVSRAGASSKPTKTQIENEGFKQNILDILTEGDRPMTVSEIMEDSRIEGLKNQRVTALLTQLKNANLVTRTVDKKKSYYSIAE